MDDSTDTACDGLGLYRPERGSLALSVVQGPLFGWPGVRCLALINQRGGVCQSSLAEFLYNTDAVVKHVKSHPLLPDSDKLGGEVKKISTAIRRTVWQGLVCCYLRLLSRSGCRMHSSWGSTPALRSVRCRVNKYFCSECCSRSGWDMRH